MADEAHAIEVAGKKLTCPMCGGKEFHTRHARLHGAAASFFKIEWLAERADCYVCAKCGNVQWFVKVEE